MGGGLCLFLPFPTTLSLSTSPIPPPMTVDPIITRPPSSIFWALTYSIVGVVTSCLLPNDSIFHGRRIVVGVRVREWWVDCPTSPPTYLPPHNNRP